MPLDALLAGHRGQTTFAPVYHFSLASGVSFFSYDAHTGSLNVYFVAANPFIIPDVGNISDSPPAHFMGSPRFDGKKYAGPYQSDGKAGARSWSAWFLYSIYTSIHIDYEWLHGDVETACPKSAWEDYDRQFRNLDMAQFVNEKPNTVTAVQIARLDRRLDMLVALVC